MIESSEMTNMTNSTELTPFNNDSATNHFFSKQDNIIEQGSK